MGNWLSRAFDDDGRLNGPAPSAILHRDVTRVPLTVYTDKGNWLQLSDGACVYDASGGAAVSNLGHGYKVRIWDAMARVFFGSVDYIASLSFTTSIEKRLSVALIETTRGLFSKVIFYNSGSDGIEAAMKMARQYHVEREGKDSERTWFISREQSYHGNTLGALALSGHKARRKIYEPMLAKNVRHISACNQYRDRGQNESTEDYVARKAQELENMFQEVGPKKVIAVALEPVSGASMGCVAPPPGYIKALKAVCRRHGALLIGDEIMCGMGRTGTWHAYQQEVEGSQPDILVMGKGLAAGAQPISAMLVSQQIVDVLGKGSKCFVHGHTFQNHPLACAAALEVVNIIQDERLLENVVRIGDLLEKLLHEKLDHLVGVGNIRGRGCFQGVEFVENKVTKTPFRPDQHVAARIHEKALGPDYQIYVYPGTGTANGEEGDHIIIAPPFNATEADIRWLVDRVAKVIIDYFGQDEKTDTSES
ncbi:aminotransferase-like protein [Lentithecium fluviatile CBS 122367]|uniref:Aminotransferase-like protein n=1 Tax=Lentithecium fluviatile CBS 122367 TaxID=1168545 RepID=A0A6G1J089_9PLEO|nr:aminotransferase-like protein [Lentithecium fluviatile CBS 122367]